jgi:hypothetical protein
MSATGYSVLAHRGSRNLADAMQTYALARLLSGKCSAIYRDLAGRQASAHPLVANGSLGANPGRKQHAAHFAGIFIGADDQDNLHWLSTLSASPCVGARDPFTQQRLAAAGIPAKMIGCATLTLPRYLGERRGILHIDDDTPHCMTQEIPEDMTWEDQWQLAQMRLHQLAHAASVHTTRLHVALPCLALGTPVCCHPEGEQLERYSLLTALEVPPGETVWKDPSLLAQEYLRFLGHALQTTLTPHQEPPFPEAEPEFDHSARE